MTNAIYFQSLNRTATLFGVDRSLFFLCVALCVPIAVSGRFSLLMDSMAVGLFMGLLAVSAWLTKADPEMLLIYRRHIRYARYYAAVPGVHAHLPLIKPSVPLYREKKTW